MHSARIQKKWAAIQIKHVAVLIPLYGFCPLWIFTSRHESWGATPTHLGILFSTVHSSLTRVSTCSQFYYDPETRD